HRAPCFAARLRRAGTDVFHHLGIRAHGRVGIEVVVPESSHAQARRLELRNLHRPPETSRSAPVVYDASSESSHRIAFAISCGSPPRCMGTKLFTRSMRFGSPPLA